MLEDQVAESVDDSRNESHGTGSRAQKATPSNRSKGGANVGWISKKVPLKAPISSQSSGKSSFAASSFSFNKA